ncbi:MAG: WD40 repeat domain-containing protein [Candidatus Poribacteria bacterium]|nr:WD40 repeat domain-containing protein [Candidatus Poribacteria bacterium]
MKNILFSTLITLIVIFTFTTDSSAQEDPQQGEAPSNVKVHTGKGSIRIRDIKYSPDGKRLAVACSNNGVLLYKTQTVEKPDLLADQPESAWSVSFSPDGTMLASAGRHNTITQLNKNIGGQLPIYKDIFKSGLTSVEFSPDSNMLATSNVDRIINLLDVRTGKLLHTLTGHTKRIRTMVFSPDGKTLATGTRDTIRLWDVDTGKHIRTHINHAIFVRGVAFSPDGKTIAMQTTGKSIFTITLWDVDSGKALRPLIDNQVILSRMGSVHSMAFSPDGKTIVTAGVFAIHLWNVDTGEHIRMLTGQLNSYAGPGPFVLYSPDGTTIVTAGMGEIHLWDGNTGNHIRKLLTDL